MKTTARTAPIYLGLSAAYDHFNHTLFAGELPECVITLQRHKGAYGYFSGSALTTHGEPKDVTDEIALNPAHFNGRGKMDILSTLVHEMAHLWQHHFGRPSRNGYHNAQWADKMFAVGLVPTATGEPGGNTTGQQMHHSITLDGPFHTACKAFLSHNHLPLCQDRPKLLIDRITKAASKTKYTCPDCGLNAWAKPEAHLVCEDCDERMEAEE